MKIVRSSQTKTFQNSPECSALEFPMDDKDINGAIIKLKGRYPEKGVAINQVCKELAYVIKGSGKIVVNGKENDLNTGDLVLIMPGEKYFWTGQMEMFVPCTPAWFPEQHIIDGEGRV